MHADPAYVQILDEILDLHYEKSSGYGTSDDLYANYTAVAEVSGEPPWRYPRRRFIEKLTRIESLEAQGRIDEIEEEHLDMASLIICAEVLRRRATPSAEEPPARTDMAGAERGRTPASPSVEPLIGLTTLFASAEHGPRPDAGLSGDDDRALAFFAGILRDRIRMLEQGAGQAERLNEIEPQRDHLVQLTPEYARLIARDLCGAADLIGPSEARDLRSTVRTPQSDARSREPVMATAHTPCKRPVFASDQTAGEMLRSRIEARAGQDTTGVGRHTPSPAHDEPARLRDAQRGDDGWVRA